MSNLDQIGEQAAEGLRLFDKQTDRVRENLRIIRDAFAEAKKNKVEITINGQSGWTAWAKWSNPKAKNPLRAIQYVLKGKRDRSQEIKKRTSGSRVITLKSGMTVKIGKRTFTLVSIGDRLVPDGVEDDYGVFTKTIDGKRQEIAGCDCTAELNLKEIDPKYTHIKVSTRKAYCQERYPNRKIKGLKFAKKDEEPTCPNCIAERKAMAERREMLDREREADYAEARAEREKGTSVKIKLTDSQMREAGVVIAPLSNAKKLTRSAHAVTFDAMTYQEVGKELILALEGRVETLRVDANEQKKTLLTWTDKSPENVAAFAQQKRLQGAIKACEGAISAIVNGGDDTEENLYDWYEQHRDERLGISEPEIGTTLTVVLNSECPPEE